METKLTYAGARMIIINVLTAHEWILTNNLVTPYCTDPTGKVRLWFTPRAIRRQEISSSEARFNYNESRSMWLDTKKFAQLLQSTDYAQHERYIAAIINCPIGRRE